VSSRKTAARAARRLLREQRRRRRIALIDSVFGLGLALVGLIIAPGIGILALVALLVLGLCGLSLLGGERSAGGCLRPSGAPGLRSASAGHGGRHA